jgi:hypothetical protein
MTNFDWITALAGGGIASLALFILICLLSIAFSLVVSALLTSAWIWLVIHFLRGTIDNEYARRRGDHLQPLPSRAAPDPYAGL